MNQQEKIWAPEQSVLPYADIQGDEVTIRNIRHFEYQSTTEHTPHYYDANFSINALEKAYLIIEHFGPTKAAHVFISFEFTGNTFLSISVEARRKPGQQFSIIKGLLKQFQLIYVAADERDVITLRSLHRKDKVYMYPIKATKEHLQYAFRSMLKEMNSLHDKPQYYNTITNNCITNIAKHLNEFQSDTMPWHYTYLIPADLDRFALEKGLLDVEETNLTELRKKYFINPLVEKYVDDPDFSQKIRNR